MSDPLKRYKSVSVEPGTLVSYRGLGIQVNANYNDPEFGSQPYVTVSTEGLDPSHSYDEVTGQRGDDKPYSQGRDADTDEYLVWGPNDKGETVVVARFPIVTTRQDATRDAARTTDVLNDRWAAKCGMPAIAVHLNDAVLYDDAGHGNTTPITGTPDVYVVESDDDPAVFVREEDAQAYAATFTDGYSPARVTIADAELAAKMIAEREADREPTDDEIYNGHGMEGGIAYSDGPDTRDEHDPSL